ncbi:MAG: viroplasmin family protein [Flavobacteriales bacterium]
MAKKKKKFYVVWEGHRPGLYSDWNNCKKQIDGFAGAKYKSFETLLEAEKALKGNWKDFVGQNKKPKLEEKDWIDLVGLPEKGSLTVDAACAGNPGKMEYRGVDLDRGKEYFKLGPFDHSTNNVGEFLALVHALALIKTGKVSFKTVYSDSKIAMAWVHAGVCRTKLKRTNQNKDSFELIFRAEKWLKENTFSTDIKKWETKYWGEIPADFGRK